MKSSTLLILAIAITSVSNQSKFLVNWTNINQSAIDIGVGAEGDVYVVGLDGYLYVYNFLANTFSHVLGDFEMNSITRVDVDSDGTPYVISGCLGIYYLNCNNIWTLLPGCGTDIAVGRGDEVWKTGCDARAGGYGIWKLFCTCKSKCNCDRTCLRFRPMKYNSNTTGQKRKCFWYRIEGGAARLDVAPDGYPYVATEQGYIFRYDGVKFHAITGVLARDLTVSNEGLLFAVGVDNTINKVICEDKGIWATLSGSAYEISAGPYSQPFIVSNANNVYTSTRVFSN